MCFCVCQMAVVRETERCPRLTSSALIGAALAVSLLDSKTATKGTSNGIIAAADSADVSGGSTDAIEVLGHLNVDLELLLLGLRETETARDVVGHLERSKGCDSIAGLVHVALEGAGAIGIDLVNGDFHD